MRDRAKFVAVVLLAAGACAAPGDPPFAVQLRGGITNTKYHLRNDGRTVSGTDLFPWDTGSWKNQAAYSFRGSVDVSEALPFASEIWLDRSSLDAVAHARLDPGRTWIWDGVPVRRFRSDNSVERLNVGWTGRTPALDWLDLVFEVRGRLMAFDSDIVTNAREQSFDFRSIWLAPGVGVRVDLPFELEGRLLYSGFHLSEPSWGDRVARPYTFEASLVRPFGDFWVEMGYELDHVELERSLPGSGLEFTHIRLKSAYAGLGFRF